MKALIVIVGLIQFGLVGCGSESSSTPPNTSQKVIPPADHDKAKRIAGELARALEDADIQAVEVQVTGPERKNPILVDKSEVVTAIVRAFITALRSDDIREGRQFHQPSRNVLVRFSIPEEPDVRFNYVAMNMFWAKRSDQDTHSGWTNLQSSALTEAYKSHLESFLSGR